MNLDCKYYYRKSFETESIENLYVLQFLVTLNLLSETWPQKTDKMDYKRLSAEKPVITSTFCTLLYFLDCSRLFLTEMSKSF